MSGKRGDGSTGAALHILILAAGRGLRFSSKDRAATEAPAPAMVAEREAGPKQPKQPKQLLALAGRPLLFHSLNTFLKWHPEAKIVVVVPRQHLLQTERMLSALLPEGSAIQVSGRGKGSGSAAISIIPGEESRHLSCVEGIEFLLSYADPMDHLLIHDAARPLLQVEELERLYSAIKKNRGAAVSLAIRLSDTLAKAGDWRAPVQGFLPRGQVFALKTPQGSDIATLQKILKERALPQSSASGFAVGGGPAGLHRGNCSRDQKRNSENYTDLLTWAAAYGVECLLEEADARNLKLTYPQDQALLESLLA